MRIVIMADGKGIRWNNNFGIPKHFAEICGEQIIARTIRLLYTISDKHEIIVTSHDKRYEFKGARRYEPLNNVYEIDRFTEELITDDICFLYGDTYYTEEALELIMNTEVEDVLFFGNKESIVAVKIVNAEVFNKHTRKVRALYENKKITSCIGWQVYQSFTGQDFNKDIVIGRKFVLINDKTTDINTPMDYELMRRDETL